MCEKLDPKELRFSVSPKYGSPRAQREAVRAEFARLSEPHDPWTKDNNHNYLFCEHPTCSMVREYETTVDGLLAIIEKAAYISENTPPAQIKDVTP